MTLTTAQERRVRNYRVASAVVLPSYLLLLYESLRAGIPPGSAPLIAGGLFAIAAQAVALLRRRELVDRLIPVILLSGVVVIFGYADLLDAERVLVLGPTYGLLAVATPFIAAEKAQRLVFIASTVAFAAALVIGGAAVPVVVLQTLFFILLWSIVVALSRQQRMVLTEEEIARAEAQELTNVVLSASLISEADVELVVFRLRDAILALGFDEVEVFLDRAFPRSDGRELGASRDTSKVLGRLVERAESDPSRVVRFDHEEGGTTLVGRLEAGDRTHGHVVAVNSAEQVTSAARLRTFDTLIVLAGQALDGALRYEDQQRAVKRLSELDLAKLDFISSVSHELRTPLTVIKGLGQTMGGGRVAFTSSAGRQLVDRMAANADRLGRMVSNLLDMSRLQEEGIRVELDEVDLGALLESASDRLTDLSDHHTLRCDAEQGLRVVADPVLLEHVLENLVSNAVKHTPRGCSIDVTLRREGGRATVAVSDDGPGIPPEDLPKLTERFFRGGDPMTRETSGLGLGLALVADILLAHGSRLVVASEPGQGSSFSFSLDALE